MVIAILSRTLKIVLTGSNVVFFEDYHASYPILHRPEIDRLLERYVRFGQRGLNPLEQSLLYLVAALGASSRPVVSSGKAVDSANLFALAWALFPRVVATPGLDSMQVLILHVSPSTFFTASPG